jgi:hypothetical protein
MHKLHLRLRIDGFDGFREAFQSIHTGDENISHATVLEFGHDLHPELRALVI